MSGGGNPILTEPNDKRKRHDESNAKRMKYLIKENSQLKEQVKDLKTLIDLNRDALQCMTIGNRDKNSEATSKDGTFRDYPKGFHQETFSTLISRDQKGAHDEWTGQDGSNPSKHLPISAQTLVNSLIQENRKLAQMFELVIEERNTAQNKAYLNERIIQQNIEFEDEIVSEFKDKIEDLKMNIKTKEFILHEFECQRLIPAADEDKNDPKTFYIFKEVVTPMKVVRAANDEKKMVEEELIEERMANSKIRKDYKAVYDKAEVEFYDCSTLPWNSGSFDRSFAPS